MNNSGSCLVKTMQYYKILPKDVLILQDEMLLGFLETEIKFNSSSHGHNGIKDIVDKLHTKQFYKLKIGIGKPKSKYNNVSHVLGKFSREEIMKIRKKISFIFCILNSYGIFGATEKME